MTSSSFFADLCRENEDIHRATLEHRFVRGIGAGALPDSGFRFYIEQDYQYLLRYIRVIAQAVAASPDLATATQLANLLHGTLAIEIDALIDLYAQFGGERAGLDAAVPAPTCQAYTDHLLTCAASANLLLIFAAILPCQWGYREIGHALRRDGLPDDPRFARWISEYASDEYGGLVDWAIRRFDELAAEAGAADLVRARAAFALSTRYEHAFWDMALTRQEWPRIAAPSAAARQ